MEFQNDRKVVSLDEMLQTAGSFGRYQKAINIFFCIMTIPSFFHVMITYFTADTPDWKCAVNSSVCRYNLTLPNKNQERCLIPRSEWEYTYPTSYSVVTEWNLDCDQEWLKGLITSIFFLGWLLGAPTLGWIADNYGRRVVLFYSMSILLLTGLFSAFVPNVHLFIVCRFIIGFFITGTFQQMFLIMTEIVGQKQRAASGIIIFTFAAVSLTVLGIKAYFIRNWKLLYIITSAPYALLLVFFRYIPKSLCYLHMKGEEKELMNTIQTVAKWNKKTIPSNVSIVPPFVSTESVHPTELFRRKDLALMIVVQSVALFMNVVTYYGLYLAAGDIGGYKYRDFIAVTVVEIPLSLISIYLSDRIGRKKTTFFLVFLSTIACIGLIFTPNKGYLKSIRVVLGMLGKGCNGSAYITLTSWGTDLFPTKFKGEAIGILQVFTRLGGMCAPWMDIEFTKIYDNLTFIFMSIASTVCGGVLYFLPETNKQLQFSSDFQNNPPIEISNFGDVPASYNNQVFTIDMQGHNNQATI